MIQTFTVTDDVTGIQKTYARIGDLKLWDRNPRSIKETDFERLKKQLLKLGQYKPSLITNDGTIIGGNMRHRGNQALLKEYMDLGIDGMLAKYNQKSKDKITKDQAERTINSLKQGVWVSIVTPKNENEKLEYALSDNDRAGFYDDDLLANLVPEYQDFDWADYAIDLQAPVTLDETLYTDQGLSDEFSLPEGDKEGFQQMAFALADEQAEIVKKALESAKKNPEYEQIDTMGNENSNGNALYLIVKQWLEQQTS